MSTNNPYASPMDNISAAETAAIAGPLPLASQGARFANFIIDHIVTWVLSWVVGIVVGVAYALSRSNPMEPIQRQDEVTLQLLGYAIGIAVVVFYFLVTEGIFHRSLAKFITGTRVVRADGGPPSFGQLLGRTLARFIPFEAFSFLGGKGFPVGWHDSISGTRVIKTR